MNQETRHVLGPKLSLKWQLQSHFPCGPVGASERPDVSLKSPQISEE